MSGRGGLPRCRLIVEIGRPVQNPSVSETDEQPVRFPTTQWWLLLKAGGADQAEKRFALERLIRSYMQPIRAFVASRRGANTDQVDDIVQDFMTLKWIERDFLDRFTPEKGRFRSYLVVSLGRFVSNWLRDRRAIRAEKEIPPETLGCGDGPEAHFERAWACRVVSDAVERFRENCSELGRPELWGVFEARVLTPTMAGCKPTQYAELIRIFGFKSPMQAGNALVTAKRAFARVLTQVIAEHDGPIEELDVEIAALMRMLGRGG